MGKISSLILAAVAGLGIGLSARASVVARNSPAAIRERAAKQAEYAATVDRLNRRRTARKERIGKASKFTVYGHYIGR